MKEKEKEEYGGRPNKKATSFSAKNTHQTVTSQNTASNIIMRYYALNAKTAINVKTFKRTTKTAKGMRGA